MPFTSLTQIQTGYVLRALAGACSDMIDCEKQYPGGVLPSYVIGLSDQLHLLFDDFEVKILHPFTKSNPSEQVLIIQKGQQVDVAQSVWEAKAKAVLHICQQIGAW